MTRTGFEACGLVGKVGRVGTGSVLCSRGPGLVRVGICWGDNCRVEEGSAGNQLGGGLRVVDGNGALSCATAWVNVGICWDENCSVAEGSVGERLEGGLRGRDGDETWTWVMARVGLGKRGSMAARSGIVFLYVGRDV